MKKISLITLLLLTLTITNSFAKPPKPKTEKLTPDQEKAFNEYKALEEVQKSLKFQNGNITLGSNLAVAKLSSEYRFLGPEDTEKVLTQLWGNPPSKKRPLGMIVPVDIDVLDMNSWAVVITNTEDGYVEDGDADSIDYSQLLKDMQEATKEESVERSKQGFGTMELVGWASPPRYDKASHKLYWAQNLIFSNSNGGNTLNYDVRILGRRGYISMNAIAAMDDVENIKQKMEALLPAVEYTPGNRYEDFDSSTDKVAEYGLAALVAGSIAAKTGLLKMIGLALVKFSKLIIVGVLLAGGVISKFLFGKKSEE